MIVFENNIENEALKKYFKDRIADVNNSNLIIVSTDDFDYLKKFVIPLTRITHIEENNDGLCIWWKWRNELENKDITMSNNFFEFIFS